MIDTHSHLFEDEFADDLEDCIQRCRKRNINKILLVGFSKETNEKAYRLSKTYDLFYPTAGIHPSEATEDYMEKLKELEEFIRAHKVYAVGECGLDYHYGKEFSEIQKDLFRRQIELSIRYELPLIVHMRDASSDTLEMIKAYHGKIRGVMHCYSGSLEMAQEFIKLGFYISLGGPVTFKNAKESKRVAAEIPLSRLLIETDCPYLAPVPFRGSRNESAYVYYVAKEIAELRHMRLEEIEEITTYNSEKLFGI